MAKSQKMTDLGVFAKFVITRHYRRLRSRSWQQNAVLCLHFKCVLIRRWCNLRQGVCKAPIIGLLFWAFSLAPPLAKSQKMTNLGVFATFFITRLYGHLRGRSLQHNAVLCLHFKCILIRRWCNLRQGIFEAPIFGLFFLSIFPWSPLGKISENDRFRWLCQICHNSALRTLTEQQLAAKCCAMFALQVHTT